MEQTKDYNLILSGAEINYIGQLLSARPYSEVFQVIPKIQNQIDAQNQAPTGPTVEPPKPE